VLALAATLVVSGPAAVHAHGPRDTGASALARMVVPEAATHNAPPAPTDAGALSSTTSAAIAERALSLTAARGSSSSFTIAALAALLLLVSALRGRRMLAATLVLMAVVLSFEAGLHSVHHLGDSDRSAACAVASASAHLNGVSVQPPDAEPRAPAAAERVTHLASTPRCSFVIAPHEGRGPPALTSPLA
jgi:hypothetical protein